VPIVTGSETVSDPQGVNLTQVVLNGSVLETPNGRVSMLGFGHGLTDAEVAAVVNFTGQALAGHAANLAAQDVDTRR
jgi:mono/diheme cytochrome c family protein